MSHRPSRAARATSRGRTARAARVALAAVTLLATASLLTPRVATAADPAAAAVLTLRSMSDSGTDPLVWAGQVTNVGTDTLRDLRVQLRLDESPAGSRSELAAFTQSTDPSPGSSVDGALATVAASLAPGESAAWQLSVPAARLRLSAGFGVYPMALDLRGELPSGDRTSLALIRTFLPWGDAATSVLPTKVALVVPVVTAPTRAPDGRQGSQNAQLHDVLTGRLAAVLAATKAHRVTYALDGDLLEAAQADELDATGPSWLATLVGQLRGSEALALPYADPDLVAASQVGRPGDLTVARQLGTAAVRAVLPAGTEVTDDVAWPADGTLDAATRTNLATAGHKALLVSDRYAPAVASQTYTPAAVGPITGTPFTAVVSDSVLSNLLATSATRQGGAVLARQRFLAELAMITAEEPSVQRSVVVTAPRNWTPDAGYVGGLLTAVDDSPYAQLATLGELRTDAGTTGPARTVPGFPNRLQAGLIDATQLATVGEARARLATLEAILTTPAPIVEPLQRSLFRAMSASWRSARPQGRDYAREAAALVTATQGKVHLVGSSALTLSGQSGRIPITVANDLDHPVNVRVLLTAIPAIRLTLTEPATVTIAAGQRQTVEVSAQAAGNGSVDVQAMLLTADGTPYGAPVSFPVQVTGLGAVASAVVGGALALLAVALVIRIARAVRAGRRPGSPASVREKAAAP